MWRTFCLGLAVGAAMACNGRPTGEVRLEVDARAPLPEIVGSLFYVVTFVNDSPKTEVLKAMKFGAGFPGGGRFYACSLEQWHPTSQEWRTVLPVKRSMQTN